MSKASREHASRAHIPHARQKPKYAPPEEISGTLVDNAADAAPVVEEAPAKASSAPLQKPISLGSVDKAKAAKKKKTSKKKATKKVK